MFLLFYVGFLSVYVFHNKGTKYTSAQIAHTHCMCTFSRQQQQHNNKTWIIKTAVFEGRINLPNEKTDIFDIRRFQNTLTIFQVMDTVSAWRTILKITKLYEWNNQGVIYTYCILSLCRSLSNKKTVGLRLCPSKAIRRTLMRNMKFKDSYEQIQFKYRYS